MSGIFQKKNKKKVSGLQVFGEAISSLLGLAFASIFLIVGGMFILTGVITLRDLGTLKNTPLMDIANIKQGEIVKFIAKPDDSVLYKFPNNDQMVSFYWIDYNEYYRSDDSTYKKTYETKRKPKDLTLKANGNNYLISTVDPEPNMYFTVDMTYYYDPSAKKYVLTDRTSFSAGVKTKQERIIYPTEKVHVFGKLESIENPYPNVYKLNLARQINSDPFNNTELYISEFLKTLFGSELSFSIVSTKDLKYVEEDLGSFSTYGFMLFGAAFCIIPLIFVFSILGNLIKTLISFGQNF